MKERLGQLRAMGIRTVMITGDNPLTAAAIASEAGVDDFLSQASPADKPSSPISRKSRAKAGWSR
jgi:K+-transporting ATPase ATPase B chain